MIEKLASQKHNKSDSKHNRHYKRRFVKGKKKSTDNKKVIQNELTAVTTAQVKTKSQSIIKLSNIEISLSGGKTTTNSLMANRF